MKIFELTFAFLLAVILAAGTSFLFFQAGYGAVGLLILSSLLSTAIFSLLGGRFRVLLVAIAVIPPISAAIISNFHFAAERLDPWPALLKILPVALTSFGLFAGLPILLVFAVQRLNSRQVDS